MFLQKCKQFWPYVFRREDHALLPACTFHSVGYKHLQPKVIKCIPDLCPDGSQGRASYCGVCLFGCILVEKAKIEGLFFALQNQVIAWLLKASVANGLGSWNLSLNTGSGIPRTHDLQRKKMLPLVLKPWRPAHAGCNTSPAALSAHGYAIGTVLGGTLGNLAPWKTGCLVWVTLKSRGWCCWIEACPPLSLHVLPNRAALGSFCGSARPY